MRTTILALIASLLVPIAAAEACGHRGRCRKRHYMPPAACTPTFSTAPVLTHPTPAIVVATYPTPAAPTMSTRPPQEVRPTYTYEAGPGGAAPYYYSYNDTGELIVKQWMDWVFRGGRAAGRPAPPAPIIGRIFKP